MDETEIDDDDSEDQRNRLEEPPHNVNKERVRFFRHSYRTERPRTRPFLAGSVKSVRDTSRQYVSFGRTFFSFCPPDVVTQADIRSCTPAVDPFEFVSPG